MQAAILEDVLFLKTFCLRCVERDPDAEELEAWRQTRARLMQAPSVGAHLPDLIRLCPDQETIRSHLKDIAYGPGSYRLRREYIETAFRPLLEAASALTAPPHDLHLRDALDDLGVADHWHKALARCSADPAGAVTMARTLLEDVCLHLLDRMGAPHNPKDDLPKLYHRLATLLNLAPAGHVEEIFKIILGSATSLVGALGRLRNEVGDAHGQGPGGWRPAARHATLAVNMAGGMALFLVQTWRQQGQA